MLKKSLALSIALHVSIIGGIFFWMFQHKEPPKPKIIPITMVTLIQNQKSQVQERQKPLTKPVVPPTLTPPIKTLTTQQPSPLPILPPQKKTPETPIVKTQEIPKEQPKVEQKEQVKEQPKMEQKVLQKSAPQAPTVDTKKVQNAYLAYIHQSANKKKTYPKNAKRLSQEGVAYVHFVILSDGSVTNISLQKSSGFALLDEAALKLIASLQDLKPIPKELAKEQYDILLPIDYKLE